MTKTVILVVLDSLRYDVFSEYLREQNGPFLPQFRDSAVEFRGGTAAAPWSLPSHASMFTGKYPREHGALRFNTRLSDDTPTLVQKLNDRGYTTACFSSNEFVMPEYGFGNWDHCPDHYGKALFADANSPTSEEAGIRKVTDALGKVARSDKPGKSLLNAVHSQARRVPALVDDGGKAMTEDATTWIRNRASDEDVFLFCNYMETHVMHKKLSSVANKLWNVKNGNRLTMLESNLRSKEFPSNGFTLSAEAVRLYRELVADELRYLDRLLARLYGALRKTNRSDDCLFLLCSDHGDGLGENGFVYHDFGGLTEPLVRVPLLVSHPDVGPETVEQRVSLSWIYSTVLDFADQHDGPVLTDSETYPDFVGAENTGHILDVIDSPEDVPEHYLADRLAVYRTAEPERKCVAIDDDRVIRRVRKDGLDEADDGPGGDEAIDAFESEYESTTVETFEVNDRTERRLRDLGYI